MNGVEAELAAGAVREGSRAGECDVAGLHEFVLIAEYARPLEPGHRGKLVVLVRLGEALHPGDVSFVLALANGLVVPEAHPVQVGIQQSALVRVRMVERDQLLVELHGLERPRAAVRSLRFPLQEFVHRCEDGAVAGHLEGVFHLRAVGLVANGVEAQRIEREEVEERGAVFVRDAAFIQKCVVGADRRRLQFLLGTQCLVEDAVDLGDDSLVVPSRDIAAGGVAGVAPLLDAPAVLLIVVPVPVAEDGVHGWVHLGGGRGDGRLHPRDLLFRLVPLDVPFQHDLLADGLDRLGVRLVSHRRFDDRLEFLDGGLRQSLVHGVVHFLPLFGSGRLRGGDHHGDAGHDAGERHAQGQHSVGPFHGRDLGRRDWFGVGGRSLPLTTV